MNEKPKKAPNDKSVDWAAIEAEYTSDDRRDLATLALSHGISKGRISQKAKELGWLIGARKAPEGMQREQPVIQVKAPESGFVYVVRMHSGLQTFYKIGMARSPADRLGSLQTGTPFELTIVLAYYVPDMRQEEEVLHSLYRLQRVRGEWFELSMDDLKAIAARSLLV